MSNEDAYITDDAHGDTWDLMLGDSCERLAEIPNESIGMSVYSPPFSSLFTYSPSPRDLGNSASRSEFIQHYGYIIRENLRVTMPGRICCVHVQQLTTTKSTHGFSGLTDFRGDVIRAYIDNGWQFHGEVTVDKDPQAQAIRTKAQALMFVTKNRDSSATRPALADYLLLFRKPGQNAVQIKNDVTNEEWIEWARPCWLGIRETHTLNARVARDDADERHICIARGSQVLTRERGYVPIEEVKVGEHTLTHKGRWQPVLVVENTGVRPVVTMRAHGVPGLTLTPDHNLWMRTSDWVRQRDGAEHAEPDWVEAQHALPGYVNFKLPEPVKPTELSASHWWTVGRWLADGHHDVRGGAHISCGDHELNDLRDRLGAAAGAHFHTGTSYQVRVLDPDAVLKTTLLRCGHGAEGKHLPPEAFELPVEQADALLSGYLSGDGHFLEDRQRWTASSVSRTLLLGVAVLAHRVHGAIASVYAGRPARESVIAGRTVQCRQDWILSFDIDSARRKQPFVLDDGAWKRVRSIEDAGEVETWNLRVAEDESFTAEGCIVKNCPLQIDFIERCIRLWSNPGERVLSPFAGIGSEVHTAVRLGRRGIGIELKPAYWRTAVNNLRALDDRMALPTLMDVVA